MCTDGVWQLHKRCTHRSSTGAETPKHDHPVGPQCCEWASHVCPHPRTHGTNATLDGSPPQVGWGPGGPGRRTTERGDLAPHCWRKRTARSTRMNKLHSLRTFASSGLPPATSRCAACSHARAELTEKQMGLCQSARNSKVRSSADAASQNKAWRSDPLAGHLSPRALPPRKPSNDECHQCPRASEPQKGTQRPRRATYSGCTPSCTPPSRNLCAVAELPSASRSRAAAPTPPARHLSPPCPRQRKRRRSVAAAVIVPRSSITVPSTILPSAFLALTSRVGAGCHVAMSFPKGPAPKTKVPAGRASQGQQRGSECSRTACKQEAIHTRAAQSVGRRADTGDIRQPAS